MWWCFIDPEDAGPVLLFLLIVIALMLGVSYCKTKHKEEPKPPVPIEKSIPKWDTISNNDSIIVLKIHRQ